MKRGGDADASRPDFTQRLQAANVLSYDTALFTVVVVVVLLELFDNFFNKKPRVAYYIALLLANDMGEEVSVVAPRSATQSHFCGGFWRSTDSKNLM